MVGRRRIRGGLPLLALVHAEGASDQADDLGVVEEAVEHGVDGGDVKAHADRVRAQIRQDRITAAAAGQTGLAEQIKTENAQLLARNKSLVNELRVVRQALAQARADQMDATISSAELDRVGAMQDRISDLEAANRKLTLERNTAIIGLY